jgi:hypothetical protein
MSQEVTMPALHRFTLKHNLRDSRWDLKDQTGAVIATFQTKAEAVIGGKIEKAIGGEGSVRIHKRDGTLEEERTFPRSRDPRRRPG